MNSEDKIIGTLQSLNIAIQKSGGTITDINGLKDITLYDFIIMASKNNIIFAKLKEE